MSSDKKIEAATPVKDVELDDLLDSALEDFDKVASKTSEKETNAKTDSPSTAATDTSDPQNEVWNEEFLAQAKYFEEQMATLFGSAGVDELPTPEQFNVGFQKMAEAAQLACQGQGLDATAVDPQYVDSITQAIRGLKEGSDNLAPSIPPEGMANMFAGLQLSEGGGDEANPFLPFVQGMMQSLLSSEVLLPSLTELLEKYPTWLAENADKIEPADKERYTKQQDLFKVICADLRTERPDDSADVKNDRFKKVLENMQKLHEYGPPPVELIGDGTSYMDSMPGGMPGMPGMGGMPGIGAMGDPSQCSLM